MKHFLKPTMMQCVILFAAIASFGWPAHAKGQARDYPYLKDYLMFPNFDRTYTFQDHYRSCAVCVRFTQGRVTTRALRILQAHLYGYEVNPQDNLGPAITGSVVQDGLEFKTRCPVYMYVYQFKTDGLNFNDLTKLALESKYEDSKLGFTRGSCTNDSVED